VLDVVLDFRGQEIALNRGYTFWWLRWDDVDTQDSAVRFSELDSYLNISHKRVSISCGWHVPESVCNDIPVLVTMIPVRSPDRPPFGQA
jgi:hypothetical protein